MKIAFFAALFATLVMATVLLNQPDVISPWLLVVPFAAFGGWYIGRYLIFIIPAAIFLVALGLGKSDEEDY
jgi:hypothetical protein